MHPFGKGLLDQDVGGSPGQGEGVADSSTSGGLQDPRWGGGDQIIPTEEQPPTVARTGHNCSFEMKADRQPLERWATASAPPGRMGIRKQIFKIGWVGPCLI